MDLTAFAVSFLGFAIMYAGIIMAWQVDSKGSASVFRIGGIFIGFMMVPMLHTALGSPVTSAEVSGKYLLGMVIAGFIVDFFFVKRRSQG
jgi:hypothetical protein